MEKIEKFFESKKLHKVVIVLLLLGIILFIFEAGVLVGYKQAFFSCHLGENYYKDFEGKEVNEQILPNIDTQNLPNSNGATGSILKISLPSVVVADRDGVEKTITLTDDTIYRKFRGDILATDLKVGDFVVVIGSPTESGNIEARLVRVIPPPPQVNQNALGQSTTSSSSITK